MEKSNLLERLEKGGGSTAGQSDAVHRPGGVPSLRAVELRN